MNTELKQRFTFFPRYNFKGKAGLLNILNKFYSKRYLKSSTFDVFHPTYYDPYFIKYIGSKPFVLTVYDMIHEKFPEYFSKNDITTKRKKYLAHKASKIIAISHSTKKDIINIFGISEEKIKVIHLGYSSSQLKNKKYEITELPQKFILFVGNRQGYKNFELFIRSVFQILQKEHEISVICIGGSKFTKSEMELFKLLKITNQLKQFDIPDVSLANIYKKALFFIFPSLYEGFGLPILEAFSVGCPVLCSDTSSLSEVAGDAAMYFNPYDIDSIKNSVRVALDKPEIMNNFRLKASERLINFSWKNTAKQTQEIYKMLV